MLKRMTILIGLLLLMHMGNVFAGLEWQGKTVSTMAGQKQNSMEMHGYAQNGNVREDFVKGSPNPMFKEGSYFLFLKGNPTIYLVNPKDKTYAEMPLDAIMQMAGSMMQMTVSNSKVDVKQLAPAKVLNYECNHIKMDASYDMEMKMMGFQVKNHTEMTHELWGATGIPEKEISPLYKSMNFKTGMKDLDVLIEKQMAVIKDLGFPVKSVMVNKTTDQQGKTNTMTAETNVTDISVKDVNEELFKIPSDYQKTSFMPQMPNMMPKKK